MKILAVWLMTGAFLMAPPQVASAAGVNTGLRPLNTAASGVPSVSNAHITLMSVSDNPAVVRAVISGSYGSTPSCTVTSNIFQWAASDQSLTAVMLNIRASNVSFTLYGKGTCNTALGPYEDIDAVVF